MTLGLGRDDGKTQEIVSIHPIKCLHPFMLIGTRLRKLNGKWLEVKSKHLQTEIKRKFEQQTKQYIIIRKRE